MYPQIFVKQAEYQRIPAKFPWVYSNQIDNIKSPLKNFTAGEIVDLFYQEKWIARGYINPHSLIAFRILTWLPNESIDTEFFEKRLKNAFALRETFYAEPYYRLVHAEGDFLPGLIVDRYNDVFVVQLNTAGMDNLAEPLVAAIQTLFSPKSVIVKRDSQSRLQEGLTKQEEEIMGETVTDCIIQENDAQFAVNLSQGQKTGWFFDQRDNRKLVASLCENKSVIDYYSYAGGFSVLAAKMGAQKVISIDRSATALVQAEKAAQLNKVSEKCEFLCEETFADLDERIARGEKYDVVIADPPAFVKVKKDKPQGLRGYQKLMQLVSKLVKPNGLLFIASCSYHISVEEFKDCLQKAFSKNNLSGQILATQRAGVDHPVHVQLPETDYLKGLLVRVSPL